MGYPGAYAPVISVAASGWIGEWRTAGWWRANVSDPTVADSFYIPDWSSRRLTNQDLDVAATGTWVVGPYQYNSGASLVLLSRWKFDGEPACGGYCSTNGAE